MKKCDKVKTATIGGQAVLEGVMMRGPSSYALAVRDSNGEILTDSKRVAPSKSKVLKLPIIRGVVVFAKSMVMGVTTLMKSAEVFGDDEDGELSNGAVYLTVFLGILFSVGLFMFLPSLISNGITRLLRIDNSILSSVIESAAKLIIFVTYLVLVSGMKDIRRTYMYHGAEHKTINCYEKGLDLTVENVMACPKRHDRCGTTFLFFLIMVSIVVFTVSNAVFASLAAKYPAWVWANQWYGRLAIRLVLLPLVAGLSFELLKFLAVLPDNPVVRVLKAPGLALQYLTTKEPDAAIVEVAIVAFNAAQDIENNADAKGVSWDSVPVIKAISELKTLLSDAGHETDQAEWALSHSTGKGIAELRSAENITRKEFTSARRIVAKRISTGMPLQYAAGEVKFWDYTVKVNPSVLIPRPETELLAEAAVKAVGGKGKAAAVLDIGTGSGAIAMAVADKTGAKVTAVDISEKALKVATVNCKPYTNITLKKSDVFSGVSGKYDVIVSNPPYIPVSELAGLSEDVKREPVTALNGGEDGLDIVRRIISGASERLNPGGVLMMEIGYNQSEAVKALYTQAGLSEVHSIQDYQGIERIIIGAKQNNA